MSDLTHPNRSELDARNSRGCWLIQRSSGKFEKYYDGGLGLRVDATAVRWWPLTASEQLCSLDALAEMANAGMLGDET